jgi:hypothetical protein
MYREAFTRVANIAIKVLLSPVSPILSACSIEFGIGDMFEAKI